MRGAKPLRRPVLAHSPFRLPWRLDALRLLLACSLSAGGCEAEAAGGAKPSREKLDGPLACGIESSRQRYLNPQTTYRFAGETTLVVQGDIQGDPGALLAPLVAAKLLRLRPLATAPSAAQGEAVGNAEAPPESGAEIEAGALLAMQTPFPIENWSFEWLEGNTTYVQIGDLIHGSDETKGGSDDVGVVHASIALRNAIQARSGNHLSILGNHEASFFPVPQLKLFPALRQRYGDEGVCDKLFPNDTTFGGFLRSAYGVVLINRVALTHTGYVGDALYDPHEGPCASAQAEGELWARYSERLEKSLALLPNRDGFLIHDMALGRIGDDGKPIEGSKAAGSGVLVEAYWWNTRTEWTPLGQPSTQARQGNWLPHYFASLGVDDIVFGHNAKPFAKKKDEIPQIVGRYIEEPPAGLRSRALYKVDVRASRRASMMPRHWLLRCATWIEHAPGQGLSCTGFERFRWEPLNDPSASSAGWEPVSTKPLERAPATSAEVSETLQES